MTTLATQTLTGTVTTRSERAAAQVARRAQLDGHKAAIFTRATDEVLFGAVFALEAKHDGGAPMDEAEQMTRGWILGELEARHPDVDPLMDAWVDSDADPKGYSRALMVAVAAVTPAARAQVAPAAPAPAAQVSAQRAERIARVARVRMLAARYPGRVHLIGAGNAVAIPAADVKPGDVRLYNYGGTAIVLEVRPKGKASVLIVTEENGQRYERTARLTSLLAISDRPDVNL